MRESLLEKRIRERREREEEAERIKQEVANQGSGTPPAIAANPVPAGSNGLFLVSTVQGNATEAKPHRLRFVSGPHVGKYVLLDPLKRIMIGRSDDADVVLNDATTSQKHTLVSFKDGAFVLVDQGSRNGTFVNGERVSDHRLEEGDVVLIGETSMVFEPLDAPTADHFSLYLTPSAIKVEALRYFDALRNHLVSEGLWEELLKNPNGIVGDEWKGSGLEPPLHEVREEVIRLVREEAAGSDQTQPPRRRSRRDRESRISAAA